MEYLYGVLIAAAIPLIFFSLVIPGVRISLWAGEAVDGFGWLGWVVYMTGAFWSLFLAIGACVWFVLRVTCGVVA